MALNGLRGAVAALVGLLGLASAPEVDAAQWVGIPVTGPETFVDQATLKRQGAIAKGLVKMVFAEPQPSSTGSYRVSDLEEVWNCEESSYTILKVSAFADESEKVLIHTAVTPLAMRDEMHVVPPESAAGAVLETACKLTASSVSDWRSVGWTDTFHSLVEVSSLKRDGTLVKGWSKWVFKAPQKDAAGRVYKVKVTLMRWDCSAQSEPVRNFVCEA